MIGESLLIAPVYEQNARGRYVYLPEEMLQVRVKYSESNATGVSGGGTITITNKQKPSYELPATGAVGTPPYTAAGALIMGIALMLGYLINKRSHLRGGDN